MRAHLEIDPLFYELFEGMRWRTFNDVVQWFSLPVTGDQPAVQVAPRNLKPADSPGIDVYYKQYDYVRPAWKFLGRPSKARCEFRNYGVLTSLGVRCAQRIAWGEDRTGLGRLRRAFILTQAVPNAVPLLEYIRNPRHRACALAPRDLVRRLAGELAQMTRVIHQAGFFHNDLVWRNILVTTALDGSPTLWWIDCPRGHFVATGWRRSRFRIKDLASLDKSAARWCSPTVRLRFLLDYLAIPRLRVCAKMNSDFAGGSWAGGQGASDEHIRSDQTLSPEVKQWIRKVLTYRRRRWPEDWIESPNPPESK
jgi:hypothetical protein